MPLLRILILSSSPKVSNDHEDRPNQHENSHKLWDETGDPVLSLLGNQWKLRQQYDQNFPMERENHGRTSTSVKRNKYKRKNCESRNQGSE